MPKPRGQGFNKEKVLFIASLGVLAFSGWWFWSTNPDELVPGTALSVTPKPEPVAAIKTAELEALETVLAKDRMSPFTPKHYMTDVPRVRPVVVAPPPPPPPPPPPRRIPRAQPLVASDKELDVAYMGIMKVGDQTYALVKSKDGTSTFRVKEGDSLTVGESKYKVSKIDQQSLQLTDEDGRAWTLKDGLFDPANSISANGGAGAGTAQSTPPKQGQQQIPNLPNGVKIPPQLQGLIPQNGNQPKSTGTGQGGRRKGGGGMGGNKG